MASSRPRQFLRIIQHQAARVSITASTTRGHGSGGAVQAGREFMTGLRLSGFGTANPRVFRRQLEKATKDLHSALPRGARSWGLARKLLNIFLRDALYSTYLSRENRIGAAESLLEVPLDSITAKRIREAHPELPKWPGVRHLTPDLSAAYQVAAAGSAERLGVARVHMDAYWWGARA